MRERQTERQSDSERETDRQTGSQTVRDRQAVMPLLKYHDSLKDRRTIKYNQNISNI